jgi:hypothetical protein
MPSRLLTRVFWESAGETSVGYGAGFAGGILALNVGKVLTDVPWYAVVSGAGIGALVGLCKALASLKVQPDNGNSSWLSQVVAAPKADV